MLPALSSLSVSLFPAGCLRHWCSSRSLRIPPLHLEFRLPLNNSRKPVSAASPGLGPGIVRPTWSSAYAPFTPSDSEQRLHPSYYRGCWHEVCRCFLYRYIQAVRKRRLFPIDSGLHTEMRHPTRGVAASGFPPLRNIPYCCLP